MRRFEVNSDNRSPRTPRIYARSCTCLGRIPRHAARRAALSPFSMHGRSEAEEPVLSEVALINLCGPQASTGLASAIRHPRPLFPTIRGAACLRLHRQARHRFVKHVFHYTIRRSTYPVVPASGNSSASEYFRSEWLITILTDASSSSLAHPQECRRFTCAREGVCESPGVSP